MKSVFSSKNYNENPPDDIRLLTNLARISYDKIVDTQRDPINAWSLLNQGVVGILLHQVQRGDHDDVPVDDVMLEMSYIPTWIALTGEERKNDEMTRHNFVMCTERPK